MPSLPEPLIWSNRTDEGPRTVRCAEGVFAVASRSSPARPERNEDSLAVAPVGEAGVLLLVADGCGGMPGGDRASSAAVEAIVAHATRTGDDDPVASVLAGFDAANAAVADLRIGAGSTLTAVLVAGLVARVFHAGDSPALVLGQRGVVRFAALPHSATGYGVEAGLLTQDQAVDHEHAGVVLNVLGFSEMFVHVGPTIALRPMDTVVVASDALTDNLAVSRVSELARFGTAHDAASALAEDARDAMTNGHGGHADDLSIILYRPKARRGE
ncbi:MAG: PP2C family protein-serine/threonine phosphatase [Phycisphaerales bacterium]